MPPVSSLLMASVNMHTNYMLKPDNKLLVGGFGIAVNMDNTLLGIYWLFILNSTQLNSTNHLGKVANKRKEAQELIVSPILK